MNPIISPGLLQLSALGSDGSDPQLPVGRHLRWLPSHQLGFPRDGWLLARRPSPAWPWPKSLPTRTAHLSRATVGDGEVQVPAVGQHVEGATVRLTSLAGTPEVTGDPIELGGGLVVELSIGRPRPAAWVALWLDGPPDAVVRATAACSGPRGDRPLSTTTGRIVDLADATYDPSSGRVLLLDGGVIDTVRIDPAPGARLHAVIALDASAYAAADGWTTYRRVLLPIDGDGTTHPAHADLDAEVSRRLAVGAPVSVQPWDDAAWPPPAATDATAINEARLRPDLPMLQETLTDLLAAEHDQRRPQGAVEVTVGDGSPLAAGLPADGTMTFPPFQILLSAALHAPTAHLLGLADVDPDAPGEVPYDYAVAGWHPAAWLAAVVHPALWELLTGRAPDDPEPLLAPRTGRRHPADTPAVPVASIATALLHAPPPPVPPPGDLVADHAGGHARVLRWDTPEGPSVPPIVGWHVRRSGRSLARPHPEHGHPLPALSTSGTTTDHGTTSGPTEWQVQLLDLFGRWSAPASVQADIPPPAPPAPSGVGGDVPGDGTDPTAATVAVRFDWPDANAAVAPDVERFDLTLHHDGVPTPVTGTHVVVTGTDHGTGIVDVTAERYTDAGSAGTRWTVTIEDVPLEPRAHHRHGAAVEVTATTAADATSRAAVGDVQWVEPAKPTTPPGLPGVQLGSWPDLDGTSWYAVDWTADEGQVQVLRATGARLLAAAGGERPATRDDLEVTLRGIAAARPDLFAPDHDVPYDRSTPGMHRVGLPAGSRDLYVLAVEPTGPTGTRADWPAADGFTVVAPRRLDPVAVPRITVAAGPEPGTVTVTLAAPASAESVRVWRTTDPDVTDVGRMRPLAPVAVPGDGSEVVLVDDGRPRGPHGYRAAAVAPDRRRSATTEPVWVTIR